MNENPETQNRVPVAGLAVDACSARGESPAACDPIDECVRLGRELAALRTVIEDWKAIATSAANKLNAAVIERDRLRAALEEIESNCSLDGFPEDAPEDLAFVAGLVRAALHPATDCELDELRPYGSAETCGDCDPCLGGRPDQCALSSPNGPGQGRAPNGEPSP